MSIGSGVGSEGFSADTDALRRFVESGHARRRQAGVVLDRVRVLRHRIAGEVGGLGPVSDDRALLGLAAEMLEVDRFVDGVVSSLTSGGGIRAWAKGVWSGGLLPSGPFVGPFVDDLFGGVGEVSEFVLDVGAGVIEQVDDAVDAADDIIVDAVPYVAAAPEVIGLTQLGPAYAPLANGVNRYVAPAVVGALWEEIDSVLPDRPTGGDPGGTFSSRPTGRRLIDPPVRSAEAGRLAVITALADTTDGRLISPDEFQVVRHGQNTFTVVLPGVVDLQRPSAGFDDRHHSGRDTDGAAALSAASAAVDDNVYAKLVVESLERNRVPIGAELLLVGHSFGADTVVDLAADLHFNGELYDVTHVVAAAYHSEPQLRYVPSGTEVLVLQNNKDIPVMAENLGHLSTNPFEEFAAPPPNVVLREFDGGWRGFGHHQDNYTSYLAGAVDDQDLARFFSAVAASGYGASGEAEAIDVSYPVDR